MAFRNILKPLAKTAGMLAAGGFSMFYHKRLLESQTHPTEFKLDITDPQTKETLNLHVKRIVQPGAKWPHFPTVTGYETNVTLQQPEASANKRRP